jgi:ComF family protein
MKLFSALVNVVFPHRCGLCGKVVDPDTELCDNCARMTCRVPTPICFACGRSKKDCDCGGAHGRFVAAFAAPYYYRDAVRDAIHRLKFEGQTDVADTLARDMTEFAKEVFWGVRFDCVTFVPMTSREIRERGFNQSRLLAERVANGLELEAEALLTKLYETQRQRELTGWDRSGNVLGVFDVTSPDRVEGRRILLCDDLTTTRSTLTECAKMMKLYGAREVYCLTAAVGASRSE